MEVSFAGVDPGQNHTGIVVFTIDGNVLHVEAEAVAGTTNGDGDKIVDIPTAVAKVRKFAPQHTFIEKYEPRSHFSTDKDMVYAVREMAKYMPNAKVISNRGALSMVTDNLMKSMGVWSFAQSTSHQDLRAAARIGLYGAFKNDELNKVIFDWIRNTQSFILQGSAT